MQIKGFIETSLIDWDGKIVSVVFLPGCNFRCPFCHNHLLVEHPEQVADVPWSRVEAFLRAKRGWIDGVVVTGGEPTIHKDLPGFLAKFKGMGLPVKLDTNGGNPGMLKRILDEGLVDYIAMDLKAAMGEAYAKACGLPFDQGDLRASINIIMSSGRDYEFRTTIVPGIHGLESIRSMAGEIRGAKKWVLQQFVSANAGDEGLRQVAPYDNEQLERMREAAAGEVKTARLRGI